MKNKYEQVFEDYVVAHSITPYTYKEHLKEYGYMQFFNYITESCLGIIKDHHNNTPKTASSLIYLADIAKEKFIEDVDVVCVANLYAGIFTKGVLDFNYPDYEKFLVALYELRKEIKKKCMQENTELEITKQILVKQYLNMVYGAIDNDNSVLSCSMVNVRQYIAQQAKHVMLNVASFFLNKSIPMFYIDTDEIYVPRMDDDLFKELLNHFEETCGELTNTVISAPYLDRLEGMGYTDKQFVIFSSKKKFVFGNVSALKETRGFQSVDDQKVLAQNKKFFGRNYDEIFPEYAI